ncbi:MAG TPA: hypothetical protein VK636_03515 [Gemmatimonadaceae bacterium]|nr:hypothetical protein [Gemmatimonadaceae bacterium]
MRKRRVAHPEFAVLRSLNTPRKIQDFLNEIPINKETAGETCTSPLVTLRRNTAHCMEGALLAALALSMHGHRPLILDLKTTANDVDHLVALFKTNGLWGGITKTNHAVLRYREPIYRDVRELAVSFFHEYFLNDGRKTLRKYSAPFDLDKWKGDWVSSGEDLWDLQNAIDDSPHHALLNRRQIAGLRRADVIERRAGELEEW